MDNLKAFKEKLEYEINPLLEKKKDKDDKDDKEDKKDNENQSKGAYEYKSTSRETRGKVRILQYDVDYKELMEFLSEEVPNISWTIPKSRQVFKAIRKYLGFQKDKDKDSE
jgi:DNA-directed RNA polymerase specialized sigma54-like protein